MEENKEEKALLRLKASKETLEEARILIELERWRGAVNRLYYAAFYAASAYLISIDEEAATHKGTKVKFNRFIAATELVNRDVSIAYNQLAMARHESDYRNFSEVTSDDILEQEQMVQKLYQTVYKLVASGI